MKAIAVHSKITFLHGSSAILTRPRARVQSRAHTVITRAYVLGDINKYLSEAASQIFSPMKDDVPWVAEPFSGRITHHEEVSRLRHLAEEVRAARELLEGSMDEVVEDPAAVDTEQVVAVPASQEYITEAIDRVFGHNFTGDVTEPGKYFSRGYRSRGRTQREVRWPWKIMPSLFEL